MSTQPLKDFTVIFTWPNDGVDSELVRAAKPSDAIAVAFEQALSDSDGSVDITELVADFVFEGWHTCQIYRLNAQQRMVAR